MCQAQLHGPSRRAAPANAHAPTTRTTVATACPLARDVPSCEQLHSVGQPLTAQARGGTRPASTSERTPVLHRRRQGPLERPGGAATRPRGRHGAVHGPTCPRATPRQVQETPRKPAWPLGNPQPHMLLRPSAATAQHRGTPGGMLKNLHVPKRCLRLQTGQPSQRLQATLGPAADYPRATHNAQARSVPPKPPDAQTQRLWLLAAPQQPADYSTTHGPRSTASEVPLLQKCH
mmetsp:Transcript_1060/g.3107  ORF Transcript_1060/g.3107 Transcript_1060/m.3107 type:complete len:233 (-) Transcript_1060:112-810(-)